MTVILRARTLIDVCTYADRCWHVLRSDFDFDASIRLPLLGSHDLEVHGLGVFGELYTLHSA